MNRAAAISLVILAAGSAGAQGHLNLHFMHNLPGSIHTNPSIFPVNNAFVGIPVLSSIYAGAGSTRIKWSDYARYDENDVLVQDVDNLLSRMKKRNLLSANVETELFSLGIRAKKYYFSAFVTEKVNLRFAYPKDLFTLIVKGNGAFLNETASFDDIGMNVTHYRDYSLGIARQFGDKVQAGFRFKFLQGLANVWTERSNISLFTDSTVTYDLTGYADVIVNTSIPDDSTDAAGYLMNMNNRGMGFDFGGSYKLNEKITLSASITDLGYIYWADNVENYHANGSFTFSGMGINDFTDNEGDPFQDILDSINGAFDVVDTSWGYQTRLAPKVYLSGTYAPNAHSSYGLLLFNEFYNRRLYPSFTVFYSQKNDRVFNSTLSYSVINGDFRNLGFGASVRLGPFQTYGIMDNVLGFFFPQHARNLRVHFGIYLTFGVKNYVKDLQKDDEFDEDQPPPERKKRKSRARAE